MQTTLYGTVYQGEASISGALDSTGAFFPLDSCSQTVTKDTSGNVTQIDAVFNGTTWRQVFTYTPTTIVISQWVKQ